MLEVGERLQLLHQQFLLLLPLHRAHCHSRPTPDLQIRVPISVGDPYLGPMDPDPDPTPDMTSFFIDFKDAKKYFFSYFFSYNLPTGTSSLV
jgi:hypothetical protein